MNMTFSPYEILDLADDVRWEMSLQDASDAAGDWDNDYTFQVEETYFYPNPAGNEYEHSIYHMGGVDEDALKEWWEEVFETTFTEPETLTFEQSEPGRRYRIEVRFW